MGTGRAASALPPTLIAERVGLAHVVGDASAGEVGQQLAAVASPGRSRTDRSCSLARRRRPARAPPRRSSAGLAAAPISQNSGNSSSKRQRIADDDRLLAADPVRQSAEDDEEHHAQRPRRVPTMISAAASSTRIGALEEAQRGEHRRVPDHRQPGGDAEQGDEDALLVAGIGKALDERIARRARPRPSSPGTPGFPTASAASTARCRAARC